MTTILDFLKTRRSSKVMALSAPSPSSDQLANILQLAARVPDHGKLAPWYFIVLEGDARARAGELLREAFLAEHPGAAPAKLDLEAETFLRAPLVVAVVARRRMGKAPEWEQTLSAGAACYNLCLAANAMGFGTNWLTQWYAYSPKFHDLMGLDEHDRFAGFIYIGTASERNDERERPDMSKIVTYWTEKGHLLAKGDL